MTGPIERMDRWLRNESIPAVNSHFESAALLGTAFSAAHFAENVAQPSGTMDILMLPQAWSPTFRGEAHVLRDIAVSGDALFWGIPDFDVSSSGTVVTPGNYRQMKAGVNTPSLLVFHTPTITRIGRMGGPLFLPGGATSNAQGLMYESKYPISLMPGRPIIFRIQNVGIVGSVWMRFKWWEEEIIDPNQGF